MIYIPAYSLVLNDGKVTSILIEFVHSTISAYFNELGLLFPTQH